MHLFAGSSHPALAKALAKELGVELGKVTCKTFSSGEHYVRFEESIRGKDVYLLQTGGRASSEDIMELLLLCQAAKLSFAKTVHVVMPHFPYARQDRVSEPREPISAKLIAELLETAGADHVITLDLHSDQIQGFFSIPVDAIAARPIFQKYFAEKKLKDPVVVAPDVGGAKRAKKFADMIGAELAILHKTRTGHHEAAVTEIVGNVSGRTCILFDDMIDTGSSIIPARQALLKAGAAKKMYVAITHGIFSGPAMERLAKADFAEVVVTDSIPLPKERKGVKLKILPVAPLLAQVMKHIESGTSVTKIYGR